MGGNRPGINSIEYIGMPFAKPIPELSDDDAERFWSGILARGLHECWPGASSGDLSGYSSFVINGKSHYKHRVAYYLEFGQVPDGKIVCHTCDMKGCVNPRHLYAGTHQSNRADHLARALHFPPERRVK